MYFSDRAKLSQCNMSPHLAMALEAAAHVVLVSSTREPVQPHWCGAVSVALHLNRATEVECLWF